MGADTTAYADLLKEHYYLTKNTIPDLTLGEDPFYAMLVKKEDASNTNVFPIVYGHNQGVSPDLSSAQSASASLKVKSWNVTLANIYAVATVQGKLIAQTRGDANAYVRAVSSEIDSAFKAAARRFSLHLYRDGYGALGQLTESSFATDTATLGTSAGARTDWAKNFEIGMQIQFSTSNAGATLLDTGDYLTVIAVDEEAGTVRFDANLSNISGMAQYAYMFPRGERENSATPSRLVVTGLEAWAPASAPTTSLFGVDRTLHPTRLGGLRVDGTAMQIKEALRKAAVRIAGAGGKASHAFLGFDRWNQLEGEMRGNVEFSDIEIGEAANLGFRAIRVNGPKGPIDVVASNACPEDRCFMLDMKTEGAAPFILSADKAIGFLDEDDLKMMRQSSSDGYEVRIGGYPQLVLPAPGFVANIQLSAT